jgi:tetratricopeptide (TPR) repeat protein
MPERPWRTLLVPDAVTRVKSLISHEEQQYLTWLTSEQYEGWGAIVELGAWLGSSSVALAEGLRRRGSTAQIHTFDRFVWEKVAPHADVDLEPGADFLPHYLQAIGDYAPWIDVRKQDLTDFVWDGGPIEILFIDSAKTWELTSAVLRGFGPSLVPGRSRVVLQDFRFAWAHCLPLIFDSRPDVWKQLEDVETGTSVTFVPLKPLFGPCGIHDVYSEDAFPFGAAIELLQQRIAREQDDNRTRMRQTLYRKCLIDGPLDEALKLRDQIMAEGIDDDALKQVEDVEHVLHARGWAAFQAGDFATAKDCATRCLVRSGEKSIYSQTLLGFSLLRLGHRTQPGDIAKQILSQSPGFTSAKLLLAELAIAESRYSDAERECLGVLGAKPADEVTIEWSLNVLLQSWNAEEIRQSHADVLTELAGVLGGSPSFAAHLAREQQLRVHSGP